MAVLLEDLIRYSRVGSEVPAPERVALDDVARRATERLAGPLVAGGFQVAVAPELPQVEGDPVLLLTLFLILFENSLRFIGGAACPRIEVGSRGSGNETVVFVDDNGIGIEEAYLETIFRVFERLEADCSGSGMGLALARRIVEAHGGRIWAESAGLGEGSTFCFTLPN